MILASYLQERLWKMPALIFKRQMARQKRVEFYTNEDNSYVQRIQKMDGTNNRQSFIPIAEAIAEVRMAHVSPYTKRLTFYHAPLIPKDDIQKATEKIKKDITRRPW